MRTVIFLGLLTVADCINPIHFKTYTDDPELLKGVGIMIIVIMMMDIIEYFKKVK